MNLFIETPQRSVERSERESRLREQRGRDQTRYGGAAAESYSERLDLDEAPGFERPAYPDAERLQRDAAQRTASRDANREPEAASIAADAYRAEKAYDRERMRRRKRGHVLRVLAFLPLMPIAVVVVFLVAYILTCILNGASPEEVAASLSNLVLRIESFATRLAALLAH